MALLVGVALAVGVGIFVAWIARRRTLARPGPSVLVEGTSWFAQNGQLVGPCCEACQVQAMVRPLPPAAGDGGPYELRSRRWGVRVWKRWRAAPGTQPSRAPRFPCTRRPDTSRHRPVALQSARISPTTPTMGARPAGKTFRLPLG